MQNDPAYNNSTREILNTMNPNGITIVHRAKMSEKYKCCLCCLGCLNPCSCIMCNRDRIYQSTYVQVHENRIEFNHPGLRCTLGNCLTCNCINDHVQVHYFDRNYMQNAARVGCCSPACTHNHCCPEHCGCCGEVAIVYSDGCCGCCCRKFILIHGLEDADGFASAVNQAREAPRTIVMTR